MTEFLNKIVVEADILKTISNIMFIVVIFLTAMCFVKMACNLKRMSTVPLHEALYISAFSSYMFLYNDKEALLDLAIKSQIQIGLIIVTAIFCIISILVLIFEQPIKNGSAIDVKTGETLTGKDYIKRFKQKKRKKLVFFIIRDAVMIGLFCLLNVIENIYSKLFDYLANITIDDAVLANLSIYSVILVAGIIIASAIAWTLAQVEHKF